MTHVPQGENAPYNEHHHFFHGLNCGFAFIVILTLQVGLRHKEKIQLAMSFAFLRSLEGVGVG